MDLENTKCDNYQKNFHNKCKFCGKELKPIGLDYLYTNISPDFIEYERCTCEKSKEFWNKVDFQIQEKKEKNSIKKLLINFTQKIVLVKG